MIKDPLLSILTTNRNDLYHDNQLLRTKFILNYFAYSVKKMDATKKIEIKYLRKKINLKNL